MDGYRIEPPAPERLAVLARVERGAARLFPPGSLPAGMEDDSLPPAALRAALEQGRLWAALPVGSDEPVGFALLQEMGGVAVLAELDVLPEHGRRGLGRALVARVAAAAASEGFSFLHLTTFADVPWNAPFYMKIGFQPLPPEEAPAPVAAILEHEKRLGLRNRVAMRLALPGSADNRRAAPTG